MRGGRGEVVQGGAPRSGAWLTQQARNLLKFWNPTGHYVAMKAPDQPADAILDFVATVGGA